MFRYKAASRVLLVVDFEDQNTLIRSTLQSRATSTIHRCLGTISPLQPYFIVGTYPSGSVHILTFHGRGLAQVSSPSPVGNIGVCGLVPFLPFFPRFPKPSDRNGHHTHTLNPPHHAELNRTYAVTTFLFRPANSPVMIRLDHLSYPFGWVSTYSRGSDVKISWWPTSAHHGQIAISILSTSDSCR